MSAKQLHRENELIEAAVTWLRERLPKAWVVEPSSRSEAAVGERRADAAIEVRSPSLYTTIAVEAKSSLGPRDVERMLGSVGRTLRLLSPYIPILVVAPWLSARTRELLAAEGVNYIDLTGNALIKLENPALFIQTEGSTRDPSPAPRGKARVRGPKAGRLVRTLIDVCPPYGVSELAVATRLAPGYVSRLLDALDDEALIERSKRGRVQSVDIGGLLRRWSESYDVFAANDATTFLAPLGAVRTLPLLAEPMSERTAVTGSFAAVRLAAVASPALLSIYCDNVNALASTLDLIPADEGVNVALLRPFDDIVWQRTNEDEGITYVAPSQVAADCLTGNGRMPAEGEAALSWLLTSEQEWRIDSLAGLARSGGA